MHKTLAHFTFRPTKIHTKFALIDNEIILFTSANLSANKRIESYMIGNFDEVDGVDKIIELLGDPGNIFKTSDFDGIDLDVDLDELINSF